MKTRWIVRLMTAPLALALFVLAAGCEGPAEKEGERIDNAAKATRDAVNPPDTAGEAVGRKIDDLTTKGPAERAGKEIDEENREARDAGTNP
jgi:hypothetical protein